MRQINKLFWIAISMVVLTACTTQKKKGELTTVGKLWHNTTAHYNGYFNANEIIEASKLQLAEQHQDNYLELLDIYEYTEVDNPKVIAEQVDEALKKVTVVINLHPYSQWSDDCYLLAGKALYLKQDYESAEKAFRFLLNEYPPEDKAAKVEQEKNSRRKGKSGASRNSGRSKNTSTSAGLEGEKPLTTKQRQRARKKYNREVQKRKKQRQKARRQGKTPPKDPEVPDETPKPTPTTDEPAATETDELPPVGMVRLSKDPVTGGVDGDTDQYRLKHRPAYQEGQLWLARTYIERDNYNAARRILNQMEKNPATFNDLRSEIAVAMAHLAIKEGDYDIAAQALDEAVDRAENKEDKARFSFIQAQLYQQLGNSEGAYTAYQKVVRYKPAYAMEFAARLNMSQNAYLSGKGSAEEAIANLERMLKDEKNELYQDQIYFAMAGIQLAQGNEAEGIVLLEQSLSVGSSNAAQQAEAYYILGSLYYAKEDYLAAKTYFDSALSVMNPGDERFPATERLRDNLVDIARNLETITLQDSLLRIAEMTPEEQAELAKKLYEAKGVGKIDDANTGRDKFNSSTARVAMSGGPSAGPSLRTESSFFAYDDRVMKRGAREFDRRWGDRPLEDNWRRSNRADAGFDTVEEAEEIDLNLLTQEQIDKILSDVPKDNGAQEGARLQIKKAMFELGRLYRDRLENNQKCVDILEELNERFPGHIHELDSWYYLYLAHSDLNNASEAQVYKDKILQKYPTSTFGQILINPNYAQEFMDGERQLNRTYDEVYQLFEQGQFEQVITQSKTNAGRLIGQHPLKPRYALLTAMSTGSTEGKEAYISELQKVIATYPSSPEETRAKEILRLLGGAGASLPGNTQETSGAFQVADNELHYVIIVFESDDIDLNANKIKVSDYNRKYHNLDKLRISNVYLGQSNDVPVLVLRRFKDKDAAMSYYDGVQKNGADFINPGEVPFQILPITQSNYREVLRNRSVDGYPAFFQESY
ncbi:MAG: tetratricopeptide repeat protein [Lewinella sp.]|uniref:type IX secretion system periplasmic lipoprotein PorW/SprE n=1 Tax=Lewinella sp. TaxID=2004506 RepID=UPI003D6ABC60